MYISDHIESSPMTLEEFLQELPLLSPVQKEKRVPVYKIRKGSYCNICRNRISPRNIIPSLPCNHHFHHKCLLKWTKRKYNCPTCRNLL